MSTLKKGFMFLGTLILFLCSFLFAPTFLNGNLYIKQFGVELFIGLTATVYCFVFLLKRDRFEINLTIIDLVIILLLLLYACFLLIFNHSLTEHSLPFYYGMFYFISSYVIRNLASKDFIDLKNGFLIFVPIVIIFHVIIVVLQQNSIFSSLHGYFNNGSTFGNPDMLGAYIAVLLPLCLMQKNGWKKTGYFAFIIGILLLIFIQARSALLAAVLCGFLWLLLNRQINKKQISILSLLSAILLGALIFWHPESVYGRFFVWFISLKMIIAKPLGWGIFAFEKYYPEFQASYLSQNQHLPDFICPEVVHSPFNEFINIGAILGLPGLLLLVILVAFVFHNAVKSRNPLIYPLFIFTIITLFYFPFKIVPLIALIVPLVAFISNESRVIYQKRLSPTSGKSSFFVLILFLLVLTSVSISNFTIHKQWQKAVLFSKNSESIEKSEKLFIELYPVMKENGRFLISYSNLKYKQGDVEKALKLLEKAENCFCDINLSIKLAKLYELKGEYRKAEEHYSLAENIAPNSFFSSYEKVLFFNKTGQFEKAYLLSKAILNKPIGETSYADPIIIKSRLCKIVSEYEDKKSINIFTNKPYE